MGDLIGGLAPSLLEAGLGVALPGIGGLIANYGMDMIGGLQGSFNDAANGINNQVDKLQKAQMFNAAGQTGEQTRGGFLTAMNGLQNSAEAVQAANAQNRMAGRLLSQGQQTMNDISRNTQRSVAQNTRQMGAMARDRGMGAGSLAAVANQIQDNSNAALGQQGQQQAQVGMQAATQAADMLKQAPAILNQDLANRNDIYVKPYYAQSSGIGSAAINAMPNIFQTMAEDRAATQPMAGFSAALGNMGTQFGNMFFDPYQAKRTKAVYENMFTTPRESSGYYGPAF